MSVIVTTNVSQEKTTEVLNDENDNTDKIGKLKVYYYKFFCYLI